MRFDYFHIGRSNEEISRLETLLGVDPKKRQSFSIFSMRKAQERIETLRADAQAAGISTGTPLENKRSNVTPKISKGPQIAPPHVRVVKQPAVSQAAAVKLYHCENHPEWETADPNEKCLLCVGGIDLVQHVLAKGNVNQLTGRARFLACVKIEGAHVEPAANKFSNLKGRERFVATFKIKN